MKNFGKIISDKDIITKEYLDSKGYISAITSKMVTDALGFTPFDSAAFTKTSIKNALGIADWALAANKPSYDDVYLKLTGGTITGNLKVIGGFRAESQHGHYINFDGFSLTANAGLKVASGYSLSLAGESITSWAGLKNYLSFAFSDIGSKPTTLSGYGITDAMAIGPIISAGQDLNNYKTPGSYMLVGGGILNQPVGDGTMLVMAASNKYFTSQLVIGYNGVIYTRTGESQSWTDWKVLADSSQLTLGEQSITTWSDLKSILGFIEIAQASEHRATTDNSAFATYSYGDNGWKVAGPALAFANGGYKGLLNISIGSGESYPTHLWISSVREGTQQPWVEVLTEANISSLAMVAGQAGIESGQDLNDLLIPGSYHIAGGPTNAPQGVGDGSLLVVATKHRIFSSQLLVGYNGVLYLRGAEGNSWKDWRTVLDTTNIGDYALPKSGGTLTGSLDIGANELKSNGNAFLQSFGAADTYIKATSNIYLEAPYVGFSVPGVGVFGVVHAANYKTELPDIVLQSGGVNITGRDQYKHLGYGCAEGGWRTAGPVFSFGIPVFQHYINCEVFSNKIYHSAWNNGTQEEWALLLDDKNIGDYALLKTGGTITGNLTLYGESALMGDIPTGGIYPRFRMFMHSNGLFFQAATYDGTSQAGNIGFTGYGGVAANDIYFNATTIRFLGTSSFSGINLNGTTITSWDDVGATPTKSQTATSGTVSIAPNVLNKWSSALTGTLTITFASGTSGVANYYMIEFTTGSSIPTINLPSGVKWEGGYNILNNLAANTTYQISILNNLAVGGAF